MELIDQHTKKIMEGCKERARDAGLRFQDESLEYIVTNRDLLELSPKIMIPTLYDYWVHDVEVLRERGKYELYPGNPYETVINTRPAISFYNDNNPDWLNVMIFYHVLGHIDFFQNNLFFRHTWDYDFTGQALSDKRVIAKLRAEKGRFLDYIIEFTRGIDNLVGYHNELASVIDRGASKNTKILDYYFDIFLQIEKNVNVSDYIKEIERYNECVDGHKKLGESVFFAEVYKQYPEFEVLYHKYIENYAPKPADLIQYIVDHSKFLKKEENIWIKTVMEIIRKTSLFFQPQIRTKIMNEGWASYWHETLFLSDDRIKGHEVEYSRVNAGVTSMPRVGLNPYALGMRLFYYIEDLANKGKRSVDFVKIHDTEQRKNYDHHTGKGKEFIFAVRENLCDFIFINNFVDQDFVTGNKLFVAGRRLDQNRMVWQYYVKSRKASDYKKMILDSLYHPPSIRIDEQKTQNDSLYLIHQFEEKPLVKEYIQNTMMGIEYLWGGPVKLETNEVLSISAPPAQAVKGPGSGAAMDPKPDPEIKWQRVLYTMENRKLSRKIL